jgi:UPF0755 protein
MRWLRRPLWRLCAAAVLVVVAAGAWFYTEVNPLGSPGRLVSVKVHDGESVGQLGSQLQQQGVISSSFAFRIDTTLFGSFTVHAGTYDVAQNSSFGAVRAVFGGDETAPAIDVEPGLALYEVTNLVSRIEGTVWASRFAAAATAAAKVSPFHPDGSLEGLIGPGTYLIRPDETPTQLVAVMASSFVREAALDGLTPATRRDGLSAYQLIIAASITQKEGYYNKNMGRVARVIFNRLARGGGLQMDSTVLYYFMRDGGTVTPAMLTTKTPYNTYLHAGLTPTPICTPSNFALQSVLHPPSGPWLYFTLINENGTMAFASTYQQQLRNEQYATAHGVP